MIDLAILGLLKENDLHGYELRKRLGDLLGPHLAGSFGSIYPALAKLERAGMVKAVTHDTASLPLSPMSGSLTGELAAFRAHRRIRAETSGGRRGKRDKKVYGITDQGHERLQELLLNPDANDRDFAVRVAFCHYLTSAQRLALFERQRAELWEHYERRRRAIRDGEDRSSRPTDRPNRYLRSLTEHETEVASADLAWLDGLIEAERAAVAEAPHEPGGET